MGMGPVPATGKVLAQAKLTIDDMDVIELNEAFAAQALAVLRQLWIQDDAAHVNPNGGAIALGHPLGASGARLVITAVRQLQRTGRVTHFARCVSGLGKGLQWCWRESSSQSRLKVETRGFFSHTRHITTSCWRCSRKSAGMP